MKKNKGFTLIEMLVVVGIIGILAAVVLTALGPARNKAKDTRVISAVNQVRSLAEAKYNPSTNQYADISSDATYLQLAADVTQNGSSMTYTLESATAASYTAYAPLATDATQSYCVDSTGYGGIIAATQAANPGISCL